MLKSFLTAIRKYNMLTYGDHVIAGLSGGADSILLLTLLAGLREKYGLIVTAVHINHGIRGAEADADEAFAREYSERLGIQCLIFRKDVPAAAKASGLSLEEAGRDIRYNCFEKVLNTYNANKIAVAHNRNDNAETVFMHICRGTSLPGLCGIPPVRGHIVRPLIETSRNEIEIYLSEHQIPYRTDSTNLSNDFTRNLIRNKIIPEIESSLGLNLCEKLGSLSALCASDEDYLSKTAQDAFNSAIISAEPMCISLSIPVLRTYHPAVVSRVIRCALSGWGLKDISACHIQAAECLINAQSGKQTRLPGGIIIKKTHDDLRFADENQIIPPFCYDLKPDIPLYVPELSKYFLLSESSAPLNSCAVCTKTFQYGRICDIQIRSRLPGDHIRIRHIGSVKLKDYFINNKVPSYRREGIGLVAQGSDVLWIIDEKSICHEQYEALGSELRKFYIHTWERFN